MMIGYLLSFLIFRSFVNCERSPFEITVLHTNDFHSRFDEITSRGSICRKKDREERKCFGGVARIKYIVDEIKSEHNNTLFLNAGDFFQGTVWYSMFKWSIVANLTADLGYTASSLGNHEFDDGVNDLVDYARSVPYPLLAANLDFSKEPRLGYLIRKNLVHYVDDGRRKVGIVGYLTPETVEIASTGKVKFLDEIETLRREVTFLRKDKRVDIVIALGHSGFKKDVEIAKKVDGIDIVVGGHTNTFLWNGQVPEFSNEIPRGPYPFEVRNEKSGKTVLVTQTSGYGKYLGVLKVKFTENADISTWSKENPRILDGTVEEDPELKRLVEFYREKVDEKMDEVVGITTAFIDGSRPKCRIEECSFGNMITDAMKEEMDVDIAIINSGAIKGSLDPSSKGGNVTMEDIFTALPWTNTVDVVTIPGAALVQIMEHSVSRYDREDPDPSGRFLQVSGLVVSYDVTKPVGKRVNKISVVGPNGSKEDLKYGGKYEVAIMSFMVTGGDGYKMIPKNLIDHQNTGFLDNDLLLSYIKKNSPLRLPESGRLIFEQLDDYEVSSSSSSSKGNQLYSSIILILSLTLRYYWL